MLSARFHTSVEYVCVVVTSDYFCDLLYPFMNSLHLYNDELFQQSDVQCYQVQVAQILFEVYSGDFQ